jgi:hypothetical protein
LIWSLQVRHLSTFVFPTRATDTNELSIASLSLNDEVITAAATANNTKIQINCSSVMHCKHLRVMLGGALIEIVWGRNWYNLL